MSTSEGEVKWFNNEKGYGFIKYLPNEDIFVHYSSIIDQKGHKNLIEGEIVEYDLVKTKNGYRAKNVVTKKAN